MTPCMGGWCHKREQCPHYHASGAEPAERLCLRGQDGWQAKEGASGSVVRRHVLPVRVERQEVPA